MNIVDSDSTQPKKPRPFTDIIQENARQFIHDQLNIDGTLLESVAVVFSYSINSNELPLAMVIGQSGPLQSPSEFVHMATQLSRTLQALTQQGYSLVQSLDGLMAEKAKELLELEEKINDANKRLTTQSETGSGNGPGSKPAASAKGPRKNR